MRPSVFFMLLALGQPLMADTFTLHGGEPVRGLSTAAGPVYTPDQVCRLNECYAVLQPAPLSPQELRALGVSRFNYRALQPVLPAANGALLLPDAIGWRVFREARAIEFRRRRSE